MIYSRRHRTTALTADVGSTAFTLAPRPAGVEAAEGRENTEVTLPEERGGATGSEPARALAAVLLPVSVEVCRTETAAWISSGSTGPVPRRFARDTVKPYTSTIYVTQRNRDRPPNTVTGTCAHTAFSTADTKPIRHTYLTLPPHSDHRWTGRRRCGGR